MPSFMFSLYKNKKRTGEIRSSKSQKIHSYNLKHGDMIFVSALNSTLQQEIEPQQAVQENLLLGKSIKPAIYHLLGSTMYTSVVAENDCMLCSCDREKEGSTIKTSPITIYSECG